MNKIAIGLRQIVGDYVAAVNETTWPLTRKLKMLEFADRISGYARELETDELEPVDDLVVTGAMAYAFDHWPQPTCAPPAPHVARLAFYAGWRAALAPAPVDPALLAARKAVAAVNTRPEWVSAVLAGEKDDTKAMQAALAAYRAGQEFESVSGLSEDLRAMERGDSIARPLLVPVSLAAANDMDAFRTNITSRVARISKDTGYRFTTTTLDGLSSDFQTAIRTVIVTRAA